MFVFSKPDGKDFSDDVSVCVSPLLLPHIFRVSKDQSWLQVCRWLQRWPMLLLPQELPGAFPASSRKRRRPSTPPLTLCTSWSLAAFANNVPANHRLDLTPKRLCLLRLVSGACVKLHRASSRAQQLVATRRVVKGGCRYRLPFLLSETKQLLTSEKRLVFGGQKWKLNSSFTCNTAITWTAWDQHRRAGIHCLPTLKRKQNRTSNSTTEVKKVWGKHLFSHSRSTFFLLGPVEQLENNSNLPSSKRSFLCLFSLKLYINIY